MKLHEHTTHYNLLKKNTMLLKFIFYLNTKHFNKIYQENIFSQFHGKHKWKSESTYPHNFNTRNVVWNDYRKHTNLSAM